MKLQHIFEVRRRPELNPHVNPIDVVWRYANNMDTYVTFTDVDKVGINPNSPHNTPIGIYSYPIRYVAEYTEQRTVNGELRVPYRHDANYVTIFEQRGRILDLNNYSSSDLSNDREKLFDYFEDWFERNFDDHRYVIKGILDNYIMTGNNYGSLRELFELYVELAKKRTPGGIIWAITLFLSKDLSKYFSTRPPILWTKILMNILDYDGAHDSGDGIIHQNEPTQAVHFKRNTLRIIEMLENKVKSDEHRSKILDVYNGDSIDIKVKENTGSDEFFVLNKDDYSNLLEYTEGSKEATVYLPNKSVLSIREALSSIIPRINDISTDDYEELVELMKFESTIPETVYNLILEILNPQDVSSDIPQEEKDYIFFDNLKELLGFHSMIVFHIFFDKVVLKPVQILEHIDRIALRHERGSELWDMVLNLHEMFEDLTELAPRHFEEFEEKQDKASELVDSIMREMPL